jgi:hypothetical protein
MGANLSDRKSIVTVGEELLKSADIARAISARIR